MTQVQISSAMRRIYDNFHGRLIVPHQTDGVRWLLGRELGDDGIKGGILADDMGLGKTACMLAVCVGNPRLEPTLVIVPKSLVDQWVTECQRFVGTRPLVVRTADVKRMAIADLSSAEIIVTTYEALKVKEPNPLFAVRYGRLIMDEAHAVKNARSAKSRSASKVHADIKWCVTGTPITRRKRDFLALMRCIGVESSDYDMMRREYVLRRTFEDASRACERLRLPPLDLKLHAVPFESEEEKAFYIDLADEASMRVKAYAEGLRSEDNTMFQIIEVIMRLRQSTVNPQLVCEGRRDLPAWTGTATKVNELVRLMGLQPKGSKTIVFTHWNTEATAISDAVHTRLGLNVVRLCGSMTQNARRDAVTAFTTNPSVNVLISHIDVGGVGLNLQVATHVYINSLAWNPATELQAISRAHRLGVAHPVEATRLVIRGTIDEFILNMHDEKLGYAAEVLGDQRIRAKLDTPDLRQLQRISHYFEHGLGEGAGDKSIRWSGDTSDDASVESPGARSVAGSYESSDDASDDVPIHVSDLDDIIVDLTSHVFSPCGSSLLGISAY